MRNQEIEQKQFKIQFDQWQDVLLERFLKLKRNDVGYGKAGVILFLWYKYLCFGQKKDLDLCEEHLARVAEDLKESMRDPSSFIFIELTEFGILLSLIDTQKIQILDVEELQTQVSEILSPYASEFLKKGNLDPYTGGGYLYYYFRLINKKTHDSRFIDHIKQKSIRKINGRIMSLEGGKKIQLGITHGQAFIVLHLAELCKTSNNNNWTDLLLEFSNELAAQQQDFIKYGSFFNDFYGLPGKSKMSLCYGDLGILYSLYKGYGILKNSEGQEKIFQMLEMEVLRIEKTFLDFKNDMSLLYGLSGLAMVWRIFQKLIPEIKNNPNHDAFHNQLVQLWQEELKGQVMNHTTPKNLSFSEGYTGILIYLMGDHIKNYDFAKFYYFDS